MKKFIYVLIVCIILVGMTYFCWKNPEFPNQIIVAIENLFIEEIEDYTNEFKINKLQIKKADYFFNQLDDGQKKIYSAIANSVKKLDSKVVVKGYPYENRPKALDDVDKVMDAFFADHPEVFYVESSYSISTIEGVFDSNIELGLKYTINDLNELDMKIKEIENVVNEYVQKVGDKKGIEAQILLHDIFCEQVTYFEFENDSDILLKYHNIYAAFVEKQGVCDGFTKAMQILLDRFDIESILVSGKLGDQNHAWNMVKIEDSWYHMDITSDKSIKTGTNFGIHSYFNISTNQIKGTHDINSEFEIPETLNNKHNYYIYMDKDISSTDIFSSRLKEIIRNNRNDMLLEFYVDNNINVPEKLVDVLRELNDRRYIDPNLGKMSYYNVLNTYIVLTRK